MILPDANLLLFAYDTSSPNHPAARRWLEVVLSASEPVLLPWPVIMAFLRIGTNSRVFRSPYTIEEAVAIVAEWLGQPQVIPVVPGQRHWEILRRLLPFSQSKADLVMDAHLAALAIEHGARIYSHDRDFSRFPGVRWMDPLT